MSRFESPAGVVFTVDDSKDHRYAGDGYKPVVPERTPVKAATKAAPPKAASK